MRLCLIRHGPTEWNAQHRVQGSIDIPLSAEGRTRMENLLPPDGTASIARLNAPLLERFSGPQ